MPGRSRRGPGKDATGARGSRVESTLKGVAALRRVVEACTRRERHERAAQWQDAHDKRGSGSTFVRAQFIGDEIYEPTTPVRDVEPSPDRNQVPRRVIIEVEKAADETDSVLE